MEPDDYQDALLSNILHFIQSAGLLVAEQRGMHKRSLMAVVHELVKAHPLFIHSFIQSDIHSFNTYSAQYALRFPWW
jgi:hypothetical protein